VFRGVPYAAAPVGPLRFAAPAPSSPWEGTLDAGAFGGVPLQFRISGEMEIPPAAFELGGEPSEDCLYLNVWTPAADDAHRPVLVWIPGGSFVEGSGTQPWHDPAALCRRGDVVVVSLNYRLGAFGWLYLDAVGGERYGAAANCGLRDQIAALEWVRTNIGRFGGDASNVTVFGHSAGAWSITALLAAPAAAGLFHKAVNMSGGELSATADEATTITRWMLDRLDLGPDELERLWQLPPEAIIDVTAQAWAEFGMWPLRPVQDGALLPGPALASIGDGASADVPLLVGSTRDEMRLVATVDHDAAELDEVGVLRRLALGDGGPAILAAYKAARNARCEATDAPSLYWAIESDRLFTVPGIRVAEAQCRYQPRTYMYLTTWSSPNPALSACHGVDVSLFFGTLDVPGMEHFTGDTDAAKRLSMRMMDSLLCFARAGDPNHPELPEWPPYRTGDRATMIFDAEPHAVDDPRDGERRAWAGIL
jgi:para-nitrobenzyl esterase